MLTLNPGAACDVCAEEYSPHRVPHSIPCGHVLCLNCCNTIVEKTPPRLTPVCPFCRDQFSSDTIRLIRIDFTASRWNTPRFRSRPLEANDVPPDAPTSQGSRFPFVEPGFNRTRAEARRLEDKVAKVALKKCSVEEVTTLHKELQDWLVDDDDQTSSLYLSAALLHAILMNHWAHSEGMKQAKITQANLKSKLDDAEMAIDKIESELQKQRANNSQLQQECQLLRTEMTRMRSRTPTSSSSSTTPTISRSASTATTPPRIRRQSISLSGSESVSPTPPPSYTPTPPSSAMRSQSAHSRSASIYSARSYTPSIRSQTPASPASPGQPRPPMPAKTRTLSNPSPPKMARSSSDEKEKEKVHELWLPPQTHATHTPHRSRSTRAGYPSGGMVSASRTSTPGLPPPRYTTPFTPT